MSYNFVRKDVLNYLEIGVLELRIKALRGCWHLQFQLKFWF